MNDLTMLEYSRDALAAPLYTVSKVLSLIQEGRFDPDATRSGRWKDDCVVDVNVAGLAHATLAAPRVPVTRRCSEEPASSGQHGTAESTSDLCKVCAREGASGICDHCFAPLHDEDDNVDACGKLCLCGMQCCYQDFTHPGAKPHWCTKLLGQQACELCEGRGGHECDIMGDQEPRAPELPPVDDDSDSTVSSSDACPTHHSEQSEERDLEVDVIREGVAMELWPDQLPTFPVPMGALVRQLHFGTFHLIRDGLELKPDQVDWSSFKLYCGRRKSPETHSILWGTGWPQASFPRCDSCFAFHERWRQRGPNQSEHVAE